MQKNSLNSAVPKFERKSAISFDTEQFKPNPESIKIYEELNAISEEIEQCRKRNIK